MCAAGVEPKLRKSCNCLKRRGLCHDLTLYGFINSSQGTGEIEPGMDADKRLSYLRYVFLRAAPYHNDRTAGVNLLWTSAWPCLRPGAEFVAHFANQLLGVAVLVKQKLV